ncbi:MAG: TlpA family protein disulfide reductase, partial [Candidatus Portnoybacteria bacterium]|nr:TlpA family protein disulfide reductase [Candidatus Portnoybacteria bacterium]
MKTSLIIVSVVLLIVVGWLLTSNTGQRQNMNSNSDNTQTDSSIIAEKAPDFNLQDYDGKTVRFTDFTGKPLIINSWAAWCSFCRKELVDFAVAQKEFGASVAIVAIDRAESREVAKKYSDEIGVTDDLIFLLDPSDSFYQSIGGFSMPETIFVDKNSNIVDHKRGPMDLNEIRGKI